MMDLQLLLAISYTDIADTLRRLDRLSDSTKIYKAARRILIHKCHLSEDHPRVLAILNKEISLPFLESPQNSEINIRY